MQEIIKERYEFSYESNGSVSYLVVRTGTGIKITDYQIDMIANNPGLNILPLDIMQKNSNIEFFYNVTSLLTLAHLLNRKKLNRDELINILSGLTRPVLESAGFLLYDKGFVLDEDYIYINPVSMEIFLVYIPVCVEGDVNLLYKEFIFKLITTKAFMDESSSDGYLQKILNYIKLDNFNISGLDKLLKELKRNRISELKGSGGDVYVKTPSENKQLTAEQVEEKDAPQILIPGVGSKAEKRKDNQQKLKPFAAEYAPADNTANQGLNQSKFTLAATGAVLLSQIAVIIITAFVFMSGILEQVGEDAATTYPAFGVIVAACDFLLIRKLTEKKHKTADGNKSFKAEKLSEAPIPGREKQSIHKCQGDKKVNNTIVNKPLQSANVKPQHAENHNAAVKPSVSYCNETVVLGRVKEEYPYLENLNNGTSEKIPIIKTQFLIGRFADHVDYVCESNAVGKVHAEILRRSGQFYLRDLNSRNGTFINGSRIDSNKEYEIKNGDKVMFAKSEYNFVTCVKNEAS